MRRTLTTAFILVSVLTQVLTNVGNGYAPRLPSAAPAAALVNEALWLSDSYAFYAGLNGYWRMFSPVHRYDWWINVIATDPDGRDRILSTPSETGRRGPSGLLMDFRETKMTLNLWLRAPMQQAYMDHRCREERAHGRHPSSIRLELDWRPILDQDEAAKAGDHRGGPIGYTVLAQRPCEAR